MQLIELNDEDKKKCTIYKMEQQHHINNEKRKNKQMYINKEDNCMYLQ